MRPWTSRRRGDRDSLTADLDVQGKVDAPVLVDEGREAGGGGALEAAASALAGSFGARAAAAGAVVRSGRAVPEKLRCGRKGVVGVRENKRLGTINHI